MMIALLILFAVLQVVDIWTTLRAFDRNPTAYEVNPALRWLMRRLGPLPTLIGVKLMTGSVVLWVALSYRHAPSMLAAVGVLCVVYVVIAVNNWHTGS